MNPLPFIPAFLILPVLFSCTQKSNLEIATGKVTTIKLGNVVRIKEINVLTSTDDGTFANIAGTAAEAMTPGIIGMGTSKLASATGSPPGGSCRCRRQTHPDPARSCRPRPRSCGAAIGTGRRSCG